MTPRILGLPFDSGVDAQVKVRQKRLSQRDKSSNDLVVFTSSTSFVRLSSAVSVDGEDRIDQLRSNLGLSTSQISDFNLAKNLVLWGGVDVSKLPGGIGYSLNNAYGFLSDGAQGLRPMPGILNLSTNYKNNGSLREATLNIKCFTRKQFEAIEAVYLRLGYTMIVEWGHTDYFLNNETKQSTTAHSLLDMLFPPTKTTITPEDVQKKIQKNKENTSYNYDGLLARVTNFNWTLNSDLSYDIVLNLISWGDIIDSLKLNTSNNNNLITKIGNSDPDKPLPQNLVNVVNNKALSSLNALFYQMYQDLLLDDPKVINTLDKATQQQLKELNTLEAQAERTPEAKTKLLDVINKYQEIVDNYQFPGSSTGEDDNIKSINNFKETLNSIKSEINNLGTVEDFEKFTGGFGPGVVLDGLQETNQGGVTTTREVTIGIIKTQIENKYTSPSSYIDTNFEDYLQGVLDNKPPIAYYINL